MAVVEKQEPEQVAPPAEEQPKKDVEEEVKEEHKAMPVSPSQSLCCAARTF